MSSLNPPSSYKQAPVEEIFEKGGGCNSEIAHRSCIPFFGKRVIFSFYYTIRQFLGVNSSQDLDNAKFVHRQTHKVLCTKSMYVCINVLGMFWYLYRSRARIVVSEDKFSRNRYISIVGNGYLTGRKKNYISPRLIQPIPLANNDTLMAC